MTALLKTSKSVQDLHQEAVANFLKLKLSYMFTATLLPSGRTAFKEPSLEDHKIRFVFCKPVMDAPEPAVTVWVDAEVCAVEGSKTTYGLFFEGQKYRRLIDIDSTSVRGDELNERLIDKVFDQKVAVRRAHLWQPDPRAAATAAAAA